MILTGQIIDKLSRMPVSYASIEVTDKSGVYLGYGVSADANGFFSIDVPQAGPGMFFRFSSAEYQTVSIPFENLIGQKLFFLDPKVTGLEEIVITAKKENQFQSYLPWIVAGLVGIMVLKRNR